jgi:hypothetical protein
MALRPASPSTKHHGECSSNDSNANSFSRPANNDTDYLPTGDGKLVSDQRADAVQKKGARSRACAGLFESKQCINIDQSRMLLTACSRAHCCKLIIDHVVWHAAVWKGLLRRKIMAGASNRPEVSRLCNLVRQAA